VRTRKVCSSPRVSGPRATQFTLQNYTVAFEVALLRMCLSTLWQTVRLYCKGVPRYVLNAAKMQSSYLSGLGQ
jgi:hypothetical protein